MLVRASGERVLCPAYWRALPGSDSGCGLGCGLGCGMGQDLPRVLAVTGVAVCVIACAENDNVFGFKTDGAVARGDRDSAISYVTVKW